MLLTNSFPFFPMLRNVWKLHMTRSCSINNYFYLLGYYRFFKYTSLTAIRTMSNTSLFPYSRSGFSLCHGFSPIWRYRSLVFRYYLHDGRASTESGKNPPLGPPSTATLSRSSLQLYLMELKDSLVLEKHTMSRSAFSHLLGIPFRDVCLVDPAYQDHNPIILVRNGVILLRLGEISAILTYNKIWLFQPHIQAVLKVVELLKTFKQGNNQQKISFVNSADDARVHNEVSNESGKTAALDKDSFSDNSVNKLCSRLSSNFSSNLVEFLWPFEFFCIDVCMEISIRGHEEKVDAISNDIEQSMKLYEALRSREGIGTISRNSLVQIMKIKNELQHFDTLVNSLRSSLSKILSENEDMAALYLTSAIERQPREENDHAEVEVLLETYLLQFEDLHSEIVTLKKRVMHHEELTKLELDMRRNQFIEMNARIALLTLSCTIAALVTGVFGMNLKNSLEGNDLAFAYVTGGIVVPIGALGLLTYGIFVRSFCKTSAPILSSVMSTNYRNFPNF